MLLLSSRGGGSSVVGLVGLRVSQHGVQDVYSSARQSDLGLLMALSFGAYSRGEGFAGWVDCQGAECGSVEDALEVVGRAGGAPQVVHFPGLLHHCSQPRSRGERVSVREASQITLRITRSGIAI